jgi:hypothetical protein
MDDSEGFKELEDSRVRTRGRSDKQFPCIASRIEQRERFRCLLQPPYNVELSNYATLRDPFAEISQSFWKAIRVVKSSGYNTLGQRSDGAISSKHTYTIKPSILAR